MKEILIALAITGSILVLVVIFAMLVAIVTGAEAEERMNQIFENEKNQNHGETEKTNTIESN